MYSMPLGRRIKVANIRCRKLVWHVASLAAPAAVISSSSFGGCPAGLVCACSRAASKTRANVSVACSVLEHPLENSRILQHISGVHFRTQSDAVPLTCIRFRYSVNSSSPSSAAPCSCDTDCGSPLSRAYHIERSQHDSKAPQSTHMHGLLHADDETQLTTMRGCKRTPRLGPSVCHCSFTELRVWVLISAPAVQGPAWCRRWPPRRSPPPVQQCPRRKRPDPGPQEPAARDVWAVMSYR